MSDDKEKLLDHLYDGIQELDNRLPAWWVGLFYLTIAWAVGYFYYYNIGSGPTLGQELREEQNQWALIQAKNPTAAGGGADEEAVLAAVIKDESRIKHGKEMFATKCLACHGPLGGGGIGPNLTDNFWIHGSKPTQIANIIRTGVNDKGMPPWGPLLKPEEVHSLVAFVKSLKGTNPPGAKAPQGNEEK